MNIFNRYRETYDPRSLKWGLNNSLFFNLDRDHAQALRFRTSAKVKDNSGIGRFYTNSIQADDYYPSVYFTAKKSMGSIPFINDALLMDESYADQKNLLTFYTSKNSTALGVYNTYNYPQSHHAVLNNFRSDFEDFSHFNDLSVSNPKLPLGDTSGSLFRGKLSNIKFSKEYHSAHGNTFTSNQGVGDVNPSQTN